MSGTDITYAAIPCPVLTWRMLLAHCAMSGTDLGVPFGTREKRDQVVKILRESNESILLSLPVSVYAMQFRPTLKYFACTAKSLCYAVPAACCCAA
eukprot:1240714-Rhodomonas_salina.4